MGVGFSRLYPENQGTGLRRDNPDPALLGGLPKDHIHEKGASSGEGQSLTMPLST